MHPDGLYQGAFWWEGWFIDGAGKGIDVTICIGQEVASWPYSIIYLPAMPTTVLTFVVLGGLWFCLGCKRWRSLGLVPVAIGAFSRFYTLQSDVIFKRWQEMGHET